MRSRSGMMRTVMAAALAVVLIGGRAASTTLEPVKVKCPLGGEEFYALKPVSSNSAGGMDTDFLARPFGYLPQNYVLWTCPYDGFTAYGEDFENAEKVDGGLKTSLAAPGVAAEKMPGEHVQDDIPFDVKVENAAVYYERLGKDSEFMGNLYLLGSWLARMSMNEYDFALSKEMSEKFVSMLKEKAPPESLAEQLLDGAMILEEGAVALGKIYSFELVVAAEFSRAGGDHVGAAKLLAMADHYGALNDVVERTRFLVGKEKLYQEKAAGYFEEYLKSGGVGPEPGKGSAISYLAGELNRRLGNAGKAEEYFGKALEYEDRPEWMEELVGVVRGRMEKPPAALEKVQVVKADAAAVETRTFKDIVSELEPEQKPEEGEPEQPEEREAPESGSEEGAE